ncbi:hypothetical protein Tco_1267693 [Tanacetum coccineum]
MHLVQLYPGSVPEKNTHLEYQFGQLMEQLDKNRETVELLNAEIGKLQGEVEQEKTSELERCLSELQDILIALEAAESRNAELTHAEIFSNSLQDTNYGYTYKYSASEEVEPPLTRATSAAK